MNRSTENRSPEGARAGAEAEPPLHPALRRPRVVGPVLGVLVQAAALMLLTDLALWALDLHWAPIYTLAVGVVGFGALEVAQQRETAATLLPARRLVSRLAERLEGARVGHLRGLPVLRGRYAGRGVAVHFEPAGRTGSGARALRLGLTVAGLAPAALWLWSDLPEDAPTRVEARLRARHRHHPVTLPTPEAAAVRALSPEPERAAEVLAEAGLVDRLAPLLLANAPCAAVLEVAGDTARFDTRLTDRLGPDDVLATFATLVAWLPDPRAEAPDEAGALDGAGPEAAEDPEVGHTNA